MIDFLRSVALFEELGKEALAEIAERFTLRKFKKNNMIIFEDDQGLLFFLIKAGKVKISRISHQGEEVILSIMSKGEYFGELSVIDGLPRSATVTSLGEVELLTMSRDDFQFFLRKYPDFALALLRVMAARLRNSDGQIKSLSLMDARGKVADALMHIVNSIGVMQDRSCFVEDLPLQRDLASIAGTSRETVSRIMTRFEEEGVISKKGNSLTIPDVRKLQEITQEL